MPKRCTSKIKILIQLLKLEVVHRAARLLVIEVVESHIDFLHFLRAVVELVGGVHLGSNGDNHLWGKDCAVDALDALGDDLKYF